MKKINGTENWNQLRQNHPEAEQVLASFGIEVAGIKADCSVVEIAQKYKIPLPVLLNNLAKAIQTEVEWPHISGLKNENFFANSTNLRVTKPSGIKQIWAIHSGKGGVGKTFLASHLSMAMAQKGYRVGLLDLDLDCPNVMTTLGKVQKLITNAHRKILPADYAGLKVISMEGIQEAKDQPIMWRGPILSKALEQLIHDTEWGELDYLLLDLPPGTGDVPLTVLNSLTIDQWLVVSTAAATAVHDSLKSAKMARQFGVSGRGVVFNMSKEIPTEMWSMRDWPVLGTLPFLETIQQGTVRENLVHPELKLLIEKILG